MRIVSADADGVATAWAVSEHLIGVGALTLFATHFCALGELADLYPSCKQWHFGVDAGQQGLQYGHKLLPGQAAAVHYGLLVAPAVRSTTLTLTAFLINTFSGRESAIKGSAPIERVTVKRLCAFVLHNLCSFKSCHQLIVPPVL